MSVRDFLVHAPDADSLLLSVFSVDADIERERVPFARGHDGQWRLSLDLPDGTRYGLRADGPMGFVPERLLFDPRALAVGRLPAPLDPLAAVIDTSFDWRQDARPAVPWQDTVIYEAHVRGLTARHPGVPPEWRGTYLGVAAPAIIEHLRALGVTTLELMPVHAKADEPALVARGATNYWGYNPFAFFAPDPRFAAGHDPGAAVREFKTMVRELHRAGIEVVLDVVYNHTAEGPAQGPVLSFRGLDPHGAYRRDPHAAGGLADWTGCGNTVDADDPAMRALILDSLRYWVIEMHVDGFRFDLASALDPDPTRPGGLFAEMRADAVLGGVKLIAEPWDAGHHYALGAFPPGVPEWNDRYRDAVRRFWRGDAGAAPAFVTAMCGSEDLFGRREGESRRPQDSVNYITAHDGFTLTDLVSYVEKHNDANGEHNRDGASQNWSSNAGVEGPTDDPNVLDLRARRRRALFATLCLSVGVPMISGGDEVGRTQRGNNNAYCVDGPDTWTPWPGDRDFLALARQALAARGRHRAARLTRFLSSDDVTWLTLDGRRLTDADWHDPARLTFGGWFRRAGAIVYVNAGLTDEVATLPGGVSWELVLDTAAPGVTGPRAGTITAGTCSLVLLVAASA